LAVSRVVQGGHGPRLGQRVVPVVDRLLGGRVEGRVEVADAVVVVVRAVKYFLRLGGVPEVQDLAFLLAERQQLPVGVGEAVEVSTLDGVLIPVVRDGRGPPLGGTVTLLFYGPRGARKVRVPGSDVPQQAHRRRR